MKLTWGQYGTYLKKSAEIKRIPLFGQFELTPRCNLHCRMCYVNREVNDRSVLEKERSARDWIRLAGQARDAGMLFLMLTGGEVLIRRDFKTIYEELSDMGLVIQVNTNATLITPEIARWLGYRQPSSVTVSVYGASSDTYQAICRDGSGYHRTIRGIELLLAEGIRVQLRTTVVKGNSGEFHQLAEIADKYGITLNLVDYIYPRKDQQNTGPESERLTPMELVQYESGTKDYYSKKRKEISGHLQDDGGLGELPEVVKTEEDIHHPFRCINGKCRFCVSWDGRMVPCVLMNDPAAYPFNIGFSNAWDELKVLCAQVPDCTECLLCIHRNNCMSCPASRKSETGYYDKPVPYLCELFKYKQEVKS